MEIILFTILILLILFLSGIMSGSEAAILSISMAKAKEISKIKNSNSKKRAKKILLIKEDIQKYLSTLVVLNNIVNIVGSVYIGLLATKIFGEFYLGVVSGILTFLIIIFAEIIPKIYGERYALEVSLFVSGPLLFLTKLLSPIIFILNFITGLFIKDNVDIKISEGEIKEMAALGKKEGSINSYENEVISNVFKMNDIEVYDIMVPKHKVQIINCDDTFDDIVRIVKKTGFTRFPVLKNNDVIGFINVKDLFKYSHKEDKFLVEKIIRPIIYAPESQKIFNLEENLKKERSHLAIIVNEYGDFTGIVTLEDVIEELLGEIEDEFDKDKQPTIKQINSQTYHIDASDNIIDIDSKFDLNLDLSEDFSTVNGYLTEELGKIPKVNDKLKFKRGSFRVIKANRKKVIRVELFLK